MASNSPLAIKPDPTRLGLGARRSPAEASAGSLVLGSELYFIHVCSLECYSWGEITHTSVLVVLQWREAL